MWALILKAISPCIENMQSGHARLCYMQNPIFSGRNPTHHSGIFTNEGET